MNSLWGSFFADLIRVMRLSTVVVNMMFVPESYSASFSFIYLFVLSVVSVVQVVKNTPASARDVRDVGFSSWLGKTPEDGHTST